MAYKVPNSYVRFVKTISPVGTNAGTRVLGIIGTGTNYYESNNEAVKRNSNKLYDELLNNDVMEVQSVTSKPVFGGKLTTDVIVYKEGEDFTVENGKNIVWKKIDGSLASATIVLGDDSVLASKVILKPTEESYLIENAKYRLTVSSTEGKGSYFIERIDKTTGELTVVGHGVPDPLPNGCIPGLSVTVRDFGDDGVLLSDYIEFEVVAASTQEDATVTQRAVESYAELTNSELITSAQALNAALRISINEDNLVLDETYIMEVIDSETAEPKYRITSGTGSAEPNALIFEGYASQISGKRVIPGLYMYFTEKFGVEDLTVGCKIEITTTAKVKLNSPELETAYYVNYKYKKPKYQYEPQAFSDYDEIVKMYGNYDFAPDGRVINSLSLGAEIAFQNGASPIICVQSEGESYIEMKEALEKMEKLIPGLENINAIVVLTENVHVMNELKLHVDKMSSFDEGKERIGYVGAPMTRPISNAFASDEDEYGMIEIAKNLDIERMVFVTPGEIIKEVRDLKNGRFRDRVLPGCYAAVAVAAMSIANDPAEPLTNKRINGFKGLSEVYGQKDKNKLAEAGCLVLHQDFNDIKIRHGITTHQSAIDFSGKPNIDDINSQEITLIQIKDFVAQNARIITARKYVGVKNRNGIVSDIQGTMETMLAGFMQQDIIMGYEGLTVKRSPEDPRQIDIRFDIEAVYPLNYININFGFMSV